MVSSLHHFPLLGPDGCYDVFWFWQCPDLTSVSPSEFPQLLGLHKGNICTFGIGQILLLKRVQSVSGLGPYCSNHLLREPCQVIHVEKHILLFPISNFQHLCSTLHNSRYRVLYKMSAWMKIAYILLSILLGLFPKDYESLSGVESSKLVVKTSAHTFLQVICLGTMG